MNVLQDEEKFDALFQEVNVVLSKVVLEKCAQIARKYNLNAEDFFDEWFAYTTSNLYGAPPTIVNLDKFEQSQSRLLQAKEKKKNASIKKKEQIKDTTVTVQSRSNESNNLSEVNGGGRMDAMDESHENSIIFTPNKRYTERTESGTVELSYGQINSNTFQRNNEPVNVFIENQNAYLKHILMLPHLRLNYLHQLIQWTSDAIISHHSLMFEKKDDDDGVDNDERNEEEGGEQHVTDENHPSESLLLLRGVRRQLIGRIFCKPNEKIDVDSPKRNVFLECYRSLNSPKLLSGKMVRLHFDKVTKYAIFRGQIVVVHGELIQNNFYVDRIYTNAPPPPVPLKNAIHDAALHLMVASGPFTLPTNLLFEPLNDLLNEALAQKPNLLILIGPFISRAHPQVEVDLPEMPKDYFKSRINDILSRLEGSGIELLVVSSHRENHIDNIFPTKSYSIQNHHQHDDVHFAPDPSTVTLKNGAITMSITSVDVVFQMMANEVCRTNESLMKSGDRISRIISHLFDQRNIYPLLATSNTDLTIDYNSLLSNGLFARMPDLLIVPSKLGNFVKLVNGCVCINPETLVKGNVSGKYCQIEIRPGGELMAERISCQVKRI